MALPIFSSNAFLAPMAGISDPAYRLLCKELGAGLVVTELTSVHAIVAKERMLSQDGKQISEFVEFSERERPVSVQLFGSDIPLVCKAARIVEPFFDIIDYNMGCPAPHITNQMAGAALLQKPEHVKEMFTKLVKAVNKPVTLKVRAGISSENCYLYKPIARIAEDCGVEMIALHARTLKQGYSGKADWNLIKELKEYVNIPVVGNGDVNSAEEAVRMMSETGCDYVMIGRGAMGNPFIFREFNEFVAKGTYTKHTPGERVGAFFRYLDYTVLYPTIKFSRIRTQAMQFTYGLRGAPELRQRVGQCNSVDDLKKVFESILS